MGHNVSLLLDLPTLLNKANFCYYYKFYPPTLSNINNLPSLCYENILQLGTPLPTPISGKGLYFLKNNTLLGNNPS